MSLDIQKLAQRWSSLDPGTRHVLEAVLTQALNKCLPGGASEFSSAITFDMPKAYLNQGKQFAQSTPEIGSNMSDDKDLWRAAKAYQQSNGTDYTTALKAVSAQAIKPHQFSRPTATEYESEVVEFEPGKFARRDEARLYQSAKQYQAAHNCDYTTALRAVGGR
jgi:hypothetical protein